MLMLLMPTFFAVARRFRRAAERGACSISPRMLLTLRCALTRYFLLRCCHAAASRCHVYLRRYYVFSLSLLRLLRCCLRMMRHLCHAAIFAIRQLTMLRCRPTLAAAA